MKWTIPAALVLTTLSHVHSNEEQVEVEHGELEQDEVERLKGRAQSKSAARARHVLGAPKKLINHLNRHYRETTKPSDDFKYWECRRNPTWRTNGVEYEECEHLTKWDGWKPRHEYVFDTGELGDDLVPVLEKCLLDAFEKAEEEELWPVCHENSTDTVPECQLERVSVGASYSSVLEGPLAVVKQVFTEQEAYAVKALSDCIRPLKPDDEAYFEERTFENGVSDDTGLYKYGGNYVTFLSGLLQIFLPGAAAQIHTAVGVAHATLGWEEAGIPKPSELGIRTAEHLEYKKTGRLGIHVDGDSHYSISIAMSEPDAFEGGFFHLETDQAMFKVPKHSAVVFLSETFHGVSPITDGQREVFVVEMWDDDDLPPGYARSDSQYFELYKNATKGIYPPEMMANMEGYDPEVHGPEALKRAREEAEAFYAAQAAAEQEAMMEGAASAHAVTDEL